MNSDYDIFIIGGGINGCGIARDAVGRGYKVGLAEMDDLASGTSSRASKLIHGGLRYLEYYAFRLVREALSEREVLLKMAPHIIWPLRFILPHHRDMRPAWLLRLGLFLYDHIGKRKLLAPAKNVNLRTSTVGKPLKPMFSLGFEYSDCWVDDARLVVLNAMDAADLGAFIAVRTKVVNARRAAGGWIIQTRDVMTRKENEVRARLLVNASGPWVDEVLRDCLGTAGASNVRLVKGSHIVVPRLHDHDRAYIFQNRDGRIIFVIPYQGDFSLIGTTDNDYAGDPGEVAIGADEITYLCDVVGEYVRTPPRPEDVVWSYSGVRPLYDDGASAAQEATRDYVLRLDEEGGQAPLVNIFGGKITTYRRLSEKVLEKIETALGAKGPAWTAHSHLPGGDFAPGDFESRLSALRRDYPFLAHDHAYRLLRSYGTNAWALLGEATAMVDLGRNFGASLTECEVTYLRENEWAVFAEDIVWRRSKLGLKMSDEQIAALDEWMRHKPRGADAAVSKRNVQTSGGTR